jgi:hypothetical protein
LSGQRFTIEVRACIAISIFYWLLWNASSPWVVDGLNYIESWIALSLRPILVKV